MEGCQSNYSAPQFVGQKVLPAQGCTLAAPRPYQACCSPAPFSRAACQSSAYYNLNVSYGRY